MELDRIVGDQSELELHYQRYLSTLRENKLFQMTLVGGYGVIETSMFQGRRSEAEKLLARWVDAVTGHQRCRVDFIVCQKAIGEKAFPLFGVPLLPWRF